jgi:hypothetical protein
MVISSAHSRRCEAQPAALVAVASIGCASFVNVMTDREREM